MFSRQRFWFEVCAALLSAAVFVVTLIEPHWFEVLFDAAPDGGDGSLEAAAAMAASLVATVVFARLARREWGRRPGLTSAS